MPGLFLKTKVEAGSYITLGDSEEQITGLFSFRRLNALSCAVQVSVWKSLELSYFFLVRSQHLHSLMIFF